MPGRFRDEAGKSEILVSGGAWDVGGVLGGGGVSESWGREEHLHARKTGWSSQVARTTKSLG